jgi:hypothetical protein
MIILEKINTVYYQLQFYLEIIKHVRNNFFISSINNQDILIKQVATTMYPLPYLKRLRVTFFD